MSNPEMRALFNKLQGRVWLQTQLGMVELPDVISVSITDEGRRTTDISVAWAYGSVLTEHWAEVKDTPDGSAPTDAEYTVAKSQESNKSNDRNSSSV